MQSKPANGRINSTGFSPLAWLCAAGVLIFGSSSAIAVKSMGMMDPVPARPDGPPVVFDHTYMTSLFLFVGEACSLVLYGIYRIIARTRSKRVVTKITSFLEPISIKQLDKKSFKPCPHAFLFLVPTLFDLGATVMLNFSIFFVVVSVQQTISNFVVVFVALFSLICWRDYRQQFDLPHVVGLLVIAGGIAAASSVSIVYGDSIGTSRNAVLGVVLGLGGTIFAALCFIFEELFLRRIHVPGMIGVGIEGLWGIGFCACLIAIMNFVPDPSRLSNPDTGKSIMLESVIEWAYQVSVQPIQILFIVIYAFSTLLFNVSGMEVTRRISSATRATFNSCRAMIVWLTSLAIGWEHWSIPGSIIMIIGYVLIVMGTLIFNNVFRIIPYCKKANISRYGCWMGKGRTTQERLKEETPCLSSEGDSSSNCNSNTPNDPPVTLEH
ncbi:High cysteine membrane protein Group 4 [Giardia lamblia P15]|uniref:High cysteine membrane protein Group 4 n=1 Tax=Giardia intestinalis (strain P15) TaxID=658858 RepID=E1F8D4_GIAIA|nr:High cysteine membrane protein Group 4 [Giardia lamblia P15]